MSAMKQLVEELDRLNRELIALDGDEPDLRWYQLYRPATELEIAAYEQVIGVTLPPSYREFLLVCNGWRGFWGELSIAGAPAEQTADLHDEIRASAAEFDSDVAVDDLQDPNTDTVLSGEILIFGTDMNGQLVAFDRRSADGAGEREVLEIGAPGLVDHRHPSFEAFVRDRVDCARRLVSQQGRTSTPA